MHPSDLAGPASEGAIVNKPPRLSIERACVSNVIRYTAYQFCTRAGLRRVAGSINAFSA